MKKIVIFIALAFVSLSIICRYLLGFHLIHLGHALEVATSMSAKLACSGHYISGFSTEQMKRDLTSYSPATDLVELSFLEQPKRVEANLFGLAPVTAIYRSATGCTLHHPEMVDLDSIVSTSIKSEINTPWPNGSKVNSIEPSVQQKLNEILQRDNAEGLQSRAMVVVKGNQIIAESYAKNVTPDTPLLGWSMGKSLTAMMLGRLEQLGGIERNQNKLFTQWQDERQNINLHQLLQMSSGLDFDETYAPGSDATRMLFTSPSASDMAMRSELAHKSGEHFSYSSGTTNLLSKILHESLGNSAQATLDFMQQELFAPAGIRTAIFEPDAQGVQVGSSYIYASGRDWARLGLIMLQNGQINSVQLLEPSWVKQAQMQNSSKNDTAYGYQFWLNQGADSLRWPELPSDAFAMMGNRKQSVMIIPSQDVVFVRLGWTKSSYPMAKNYRSLLDVIDSIRDN